MKIFQINFFCGTGSTGRIATDLANELSKHGHECMIAYCGHRDVKAMGWDNVYKISGRVRMKLHQLYTKLTDGQGLLGSFSTKKLIKQIRNYDPDIIHLHNIHGYYLHYPILFRYLAQCGKNVVWTLHDCWSLTGHCTHYDFEQCEKWKTGCYKCPLKKEYPGSNFLDRSKKNYLDKKKYFTSIKKLNLVTPSEWLKRQVEESFLKDFPVQVINNGIDLNAFYPRKSEFRQKYGLENKKIILGAASHWSVKKGLEDFAKLAELISNEYKIVLVGLDKKHIERLPKNIFGIELTNSVGELANIYSAADVFVNPTYEDTFSMTNLEAQACGTQAISYKTGGAQETVPPENICEKGNVQMLFELIERELNKEKREIDVSKYSKENMMNQYLKLYESLYEVK